MLNIIIVIYNKLIMEIPIINNIHNFKEYKLIFVDNSTETSFKIQNLKFATINNYFYIDMQGNKGLSKAYNKAICSIKKLNDDWICIFDQDTLVDDNYFVEIKKIIQNKNYKIIVPIVKNNYGIMSPSVRTIKGFKHCPFNPIKDNNRFSYINSGMCIHSSVFDEIKYDEDLFLDCIDHDFVLQLRNAEENIFIDTDICLQQDFSGTTKNSLEIAIARFKIYIKDIKIFNNKWKGLFWDYRILLFFRILKLTIQYKSLKFIYCLKEK